MRVGKNAREDGGIQAELGKIAPLCPSRVRPFKEDSYDAGVLAGQWLGADITACADGARRGVDLVVDEGSVVHGRLNLALSIA